MKDDTTSKTVLSPLTTVDKGLTKLDKGISNLDKGITKLTQTGSKHNDLLTAILRFLRSNNGLQIINREELISSDDFTPIIDALDVTVKTTEKGFKSSERSSAKTNKQTAEQVQEAVLKLAASSTKDQEKESKFEERERRKRASSDELERTKASIHEKQERKKRSDFDQKERGKEATAKELGRKIEPKKPEKPKLEGAERGKEIVDAIKAATVSKVKDKKDNIVGAVEGLKDDIKASVKEKQDAAKATIASTKAVASDVAAVASYVKSLLATKSKESQPAVAPKLSGTDQQIEDAQKAKKESDRQKREEYKQKEAEAKAKAAQAAKDQATHAATTEPKGSVEHLRGKGWGGKLNYHRNDKKPGEEGSSGIDFDEFDKDKRERGRGRQSRRDRARERQRRMRRSRAARGGGRFGRIGRVLGRGATAVSEAGEAVVGAGRTALGAGGRVLGSIGSKAIPIAGAAFAGYDMYENISKANDEKASPEERGKAKNAAIGGGVGTVIGGLVGLLGGPMGAVIGASIGETVGSTIGEYSGEIAGTLSEAATFVGGGIKAASDYVEKGIDDAENYVSYGIKTNVIDPISSAATAFSAGFTDFENTVTSIPSKIADTFTNDIVPSFKSIFSPFLKLGDKFGEYTTAAEDYGKDLVKNAGDIVDDLKRKGSGSILGGMASYGGEAMSRAGRGIQEGAGVVSDKFKAGLSSFKEKAGSTIDRLQQDLGLTPVQAAGLVGNFGHESGGMQSDINEKNPLVKGSRGGYGWAQWTGPRRKALESFAADKGLDVSDPEAQYQFTVHEYQTTHKKALDQLKQTNDLDSATRVAFSGFESGGDPRAVAAMGSRLNYAQAGLEAYNAKGKGPAGPLATKPVAPTLTADVTSGNIVTPGGLLGPKSEDWTKTVASKGPAKGPTLANAAKQAPIPVVVTAAVAESKPAVITGDYAPTPVAKAYTGPTSTTAAYSPVVTASTTAFGGKQFEPNKLYPGNIDENGNLVKSVLTPNPVTPAVYNTYQDIPAGGYLNVQGGIQNSRSNLPTTTLPPDNLGSSYSGTGTTSGGLNTYGLGPGPTNYGLTSPGVYAQQQAPTSIGSSVGQMNVSAGTVNVSGANVNAGGQGYGNNQSSGGGFFDNVSYPSYSGGGSNPVQNAIGAVTSIPQSILGGLFGSVMGNVNSAISAPAQIMNGFTGQASGAVGQMMSVPQNAMSSTLGAAGNMINTPLNMGNQMIGGVNNMAMGTVGVPMNALHSVMGSANTVMNMPGNLSNVVNGGLSTGGGYSGGSYSGSTNYMPNMSMPNMSLPNMNMPQVNMPQVNTSSMFGSMGGSYSSNVGSGAGPRSYGDSGVGYSTTSPSSSSGSGFFGSLFGSSDDLRPGSNYQHVDNGNAPYNVVNSGPQFEEQGRITQAMPSPYDVQRSQFAPPSYEPPDIIMPEQLPVQQVQAPPQQQSAPPSSSKVGASYKPNIDEIPINISDSGIMLLNVGYL